MNFATPRNISRRNALRAALALLAAGTFAPSSHYAFASDAVTTEFRPSTHGWPFKNFRAAYAVTHSTVCGGMCWAALDRFFREETIDRGVRQPQRGDALYEEIRLAQLTTLRSGVWEEIVSWTYRSELDWWWQAESQGLLTQRNEWPKIRESIGRGKPIIVCLIRADQWENPAKNHQVIAYGYQSARDHVVLRIYDPNHGDNDTIWVGFDLGRKQNRLSAYQNTGEKVRGLLVVPFRKQDFQLEDEFKGYPGGNYEPSA